MEINFPPISIITPCYNRAGFIQKAIESVLAQNYPNLEHIVVDGGSTDGTLEVLKHYPNLAVISEPDDGVYDALNKGICRATGQIIGLLNSDDYYAEGVFQEIGKRFAEQPDLFAISGSSVIQKVEGDQLVEHMKIPAVDWGDLLRRVALGVPAINAWFFRREVFEILSGFLTQYKFSSDKEFLLRFAATKRAYCSTQKVTYHYLWHHESLTMGGKESWKIKAKLEDQAISARYLREATSREDRICFRKWHDRSSASLAMLQSQRGNWAGMLKSVWSGLRYNPFWLFYYARTHAPSFLVRWVRRVKKYNKLHGTNQVC